mmetsp:Transcript_17416/g.49176  ORF Transcript_17416/g.49176 Transcript_17416/m.49176 type:complete len:224 (+) Transcript_17416:475-1146(+)
MPLTTMQASRHDSSCETPQVAATVLERRQTWYTGDAPTSSTIDLESFEVAAGLALLPMPKKDAARRSGQQAFARTIAVPMKREPAVRHGRLHRADHRTACVAAVAAVAPQSRPRTNDRPSRRDLMNNLPRTPFVGIGCRTNTTFPDCDHQHNLTRPRTMPYPIDDGVPSRCVRSPSEFACALQFLASSAFWPRVVVRPPIGVSPSGFACALLPPSPDGCVPCE